MVPTAVWFSLALKDEAEVMDGLLSLRLTIEIDKSCAALLTPSDTDTVIE